MLPQTPGRCIKLSPSCSDHKRLHFAVSRRRSNHHGHLPGSFPFVPCFERHLCSREGITSYLHEQGCMLAHARPMLVPCLSHALACFSHHTRFSQGTPPSAPPPGTSPPPWFCYNVAYAIRTPSLLRPLTSHILDVRLPGPAVLEPLLPRVLN